MTGFVLFLQIFSAVISLLAALGSLGVLRALIRGDYKRYRREYAESHQKKIQKLAEDYAKLDKEVEEKLNNGIRRTKGFNLP